MPVALSCVWTLKRVITVTARKATNWQVTIERVKTLTSVKFLVHAHSYAQIHAEALRYKEKIFLIISF